MVHQLLLSELRGRHGLAGCEVDHEPCLPLMAGRDVGLAGSRLAKDLLRTRKALSTCGRDRVPVGVGDIDGDRIGPRPGAEFGEAEINRCFLAVDDVGAIGAGRVLRLTK